MKCLHFANNEGDNKLGQIQNIEIIVLHHKWFSLTTQDGNSNLVCGPQFNGLCIFNITRNVSILLTIGVIIKFDR